MKITYLWVGKTKDAKVSSLVEQYVKASRKFIEVEVMATRAAKGANPEDKRKREGQALLRQLEGSKNRRGLNIALDVTGKMYSSLKWFREDKRHQARRIFFSSNPGSQ